MKGYVPGGKKAAEANPTDPDPDTSDKQPGETNENTVDDRLNRTKPPLTNRTLLRHCTAVKPPLLMKLEDIKSKLKIHQFSGALETFLCRSGSLHPSLHSAIENAHYPVFKQFTIVIPSPQQALSEPFVQDVIHAREGEPGGTVLVKPDLLINDDPHIKWWNIKGEYKHKV